MRFFVCLLCMFFIGMAYSQILRPGNAPEEFGGPIYEEITVESVLTVRSKSGSRTGKSSSDLSKQARNSSETSDGASVSRSARSAYLSPVKSSEDAVSLVQYADSTSPLQIRRAHPKFSFQIR